LLRHTAGERGLPMAADGWAAVPDVCATLGIDRSALELAVEHNDKSRLELDGDRIRACQGHSLAGMPVTREALEASWRQVMPAELLWHGTSAAALPGIADHGLSPARRTHVHLAPERDSRVGRRTNIDVLLGVDPERLRRHQLGVFEAPNGVLLVRSVPADCIAVAEPVTDAGARALKGTAVHRAGWSDG
jgi:putative RNA 2'-phosphotransferase